MRSPAAGGNPPTVFFLSDYGLADEFVGVVHAVLHRLLPTGVVVDLTHGVPPFDVRSGAETLQRAVPHLGPGVVLAVVDPGVGTARRGVAVEAADGRWFVAPDNGLVVPVAERLGGVARAVALHKGPEVPDTFDGRDVFAPAAAALAGAGDPGVLGDPLEPGALLRLPEPTVERGQADGRDTLRAEVTWVDRFGNVQLAARRGEGPSRLGTLVEVRVGPPAPPPRLSARRVRAFGELGDGELGLLVDANGHLALAVREASAAEATGARPGAVVELVW